MTRKEAIERLMVSWKAGAEWEGFFENTVSMFCDDKKHVSNEQYSEIVKYLNSIA